MTAVSTLLKVLRDLRSRAFTGSAEIHFHRGVPKAIEVGRPERIELVPSREGLDLSDRDLTHREPVMR